MSRSIRWLIVLLSIGMSNTAQATNGFKQVAAGHSEGFPQYAEKLEAEQARIM